MCGIAGIRSFNADDPIKADQIIQLLLASEHRGNDATGVALQERTGKIHVFKDDTAASTFVQLKAFEGFLNERLSPDIGTAILHTRYATRSGVGDGGNPKRNENNHPMWNGITAVVHNGCISNHGHLFGDLQMERSCDTDSDIIRAILDKYGFNEEGVRKLDRCGGSAAFAAVSEAHPGMLLLGRSGNPLVLGARNGQMIFASEKQIVHAGFREFKKMFGFWARPVSVNAAFTPFPNDTAWLFDEKELIWHQKLNIAGFSQTRTYTTTYSGYQKRQNNWRVTSVPEPPKALPPLNNTPGVDYVVRHELCKNLQCLHSQAGKGLVIYADLLRKHGYENLWCPECGTYLNGRGFNPDFKKGASK